MSMFQMERRLEPPPVIRLKIPVPPSVNHAYRNTSEAERARWAGRHGTPLGPRVKTKSHREWQKTAGWLVNTQLQGASMMMGDLSVHIACPLPKNRDIDNIQKLTLDLLVFMSVIRDDSQIDDLHCVRLKGAGDMEVTVRPVAPATSAQGFNGADFSIDDIANVVNRIAPHLSGRPSVLQGAIIADILAIWLAGHHVPGDRVATRDLRNELLETHLASVSDLVSVNALAMGTTV